MRYIAAYLLLQTGGHANPSAKDIKKVIEAGGVVCDEELLDTFLEAVKGKDINQLITAGSSKLASVPSGGGGGAASGGAPAAGGGGGGPAAAPKEEEKKEEPKEESDDDMGFGLFD